MKHHRFVVFFVKTNPMKTLKKKDVTHKKSMNYFKHLKEI